jgi:hypothetical protein
MREEKFVGPKKKRRENLERGLKLCLSNRDQAIQHAKKLNMTFL